MEKEIRIVQVIRDPHVVFLERGNSKAKMIDETLYREILNEYK